MPALPREVSRAVYTRDDWHCRYCNRNESLTPHHVVYQSAGGGDTLDNLVTLCIKCHNDVHEGRLTVVVLSKTKNDVIINFKREKGWKL
jgi:5-methylcytosine-specific restriction endonuclease McrA